MSPKPPWLYNEFQRIAIQRLYDVSKREYRHTIDSLTVNEYLRKNQVVLKKALMDIQTELDTSIDEFMKGVVADEDRSSHGPVWKF